MRLSLRFEIWLVLPSLAAAAGQTPPVNIELVASGLDRPLYVTHVPGDRDRLFIVEQAGRIRIVDRGALLPTAFLDISPRVTCCNERGLLGVAFHPAFQTNRSFFVNYISISGDTVVSRFTVPAATPNQADPQSEEVILTVDQPGERHNAGWLGFSPNDGYLYIATGDGQAGNCDGEGDAQDIQNNLLGKILRIDVDRGQPYAIPPDNPFVGTAGDDEIWAYGLRNPWRCAFDAVTGDLYITDVGQHAWEEINFQKADSAGGENYGWNCMEGSHCSSDSGCGPGACACFDAALVRPVHEYDHSIGFAITGGEVYRGCAMSGAQGRFFFGDGASKVWSFMLISGDVTDLVEHTAEFDPGVGLSLGSLASFGRDADGEIYMVDLNDGEVFKIVPVGPPSDCGESPVPTVSTWGQIVMALFVMSAGGALSRRAYGRLTNSRSTHPAGPSSFRPRSPVS